MKSGAEGSQVADGRKGVLKDCDGLVIVRAFALTSV